MKLLLQQGGIDTKEINPKTMESKLIKGLYFAGEVIDIDGLTGGFNLQIAYSTRLHCWNVRQMKSSILLCQTSQKFFQHISIWFQEFLLVFLAIYYF